MAVLKMAQDLEVGDVLDHNEIVVKVEVGEQLARITTDQEAHIVHADTMWWVHPQPPEFM